MTLHDRSSMSSAAQFLHDVASIGTSDPSSPKGLSLPLQEPDRTHALSFCVTCVLTSSHTVSSSCGCVQSDRIACPGFPRPRFELGLSSHVPHVSAKRARPPRPIKTRAPRSSVTMQSTLARRHHLCRHRSAHLTDVASSSRLRLHHPMLDWAESSPASEVSGSFRIGTVVL